MRHILKPAALTLSAFMASTTSQAGEEFPVLEGRYMGQTPPGKIAEPFAPGIIFNRCLGAGSCVRTGHERILFL